MYEVFNIYKRQNDIDLTLVHFFRMHRFVCIYRVNFEAKKQLFEPKGQNEP